ncbi:MAG: DUF349 domain-containing protein [Odoribacteraceae bacterium]|jgi:hypothetical protein|nr:DUF349 domain-containing protein [Odoribacteraceae bacterium]
MDNEILTPVEEPESNTPISSETSNDETTTGVSAQENDITTPAENDIHDGETLFEQAGEDQPGEEPAIEPEPVEESPTGEDEGDVTETPAADACTIEIPPAEEATTETSVIEDAGNEEPEQVTETLAEVEDPAEEPPVESTGEAEEEPVAPEEEIEEEEPVALEEVAEEEKIEEEEPVAPEDPVEENVPSKAPPTWDFTRFTTGEIISHMKTLIENYPVNHLKVLDTLPQIFDAQLQKEREQALGASDNQANQLNFPDDTKERFYSIYRLYRERRISYYKKADEEKEENLKTKLQIIEELKELVQKEESLNKTFQEFRALQERWRNTGMVPQANFGDLQETYHLHVENFYNYIKINRELRDLDLKKNLDRKVVLCEQAEKLVEDNNIGYAFRQLQQLHAQWKEIGPVPNEQKETIWERFKEATAKVNEAYHRFFDSLKEERETNLKIKQDICTRAEALAASTPLNSSEWNKFTKQVIELQDEWKLSGSISQRDRKKLYKQFRTACDRFFRAKRDFYQKQQEEQEGNLALKLELCEKVEAVQHSTDWRPTTDKIISYQREWKKIGPVPKKHSNKVWTRFRTACDFFFDNKTAQSKEAGTDQVHNLALKKALLDEVRGFVISGNNAENIKALKSFQSRWTEIGFVPIREKDAIQAEFRGLINAIFDRLDITEFDRDLERFKSKIGTFETKSETKDIKIVQERDKLVAKIKQTEADLHVWENNIGFFSKSSTAEGLIKEFSAKIEEARHKLSLMQEKLKAIDNMI